MQRYHMKILVKLSQARRLKTCSSVHHTSTLYIFVSVSQTFSVQLLNTQVTRQFMLQISVF